MSPKSPRKPVNAAMIDAMAKTGHAHQVTPASALDAALTRLETELASAREDLRYHLDAAKGRQGQIEELVAQRRAISTLRAQVTP